MERWRSGRVVGGGWPKLGMSPAWVGRRRGAGGGGRVVLGRFVKWKKRERLRLRERLIRESD